MTDTLKLSPNERVDLADLQYAAASSQQAFARLGNANFLTDATGSKQMWILRGFDMSSVGNQLTVNLGSALLAQRDGLNVYYGVVCAEGDAQKGLDLSSYPVGTYNIYVRFNYVDGSYNSRIFWSPTAGGSEYAQTVPTRSTAQWELRCETTDPGAEWLKIGQVVASGPSIAVTDMRPMYFEGQVDQGYTQSWGAGVNDRSANRALYGVHDLQTFTQAMRTSLEDIKGPGLRRWYAPDIGGMNVGFVGTAVEDRIAAGDAGTYLQGDTTVPSLHFESGSYQQFSRATKGWSWVTSGTPVSAIDITGNHTMAGTLSVGTMTSTTDALNVVGAGATVSALLRNSQTGGVTRMRLATPAYEWQLRVGTNDFSVYDNVASSTVLNLAATTGQASFSGGVQIGVPPTNTPGCTLFVNGGTLGTTLGNSLEISRLYSADSNADYLRTYSYRGAAGTTSLTVDWFIQRLVDPNNKGFVGFYGNSGVSGGIEGIGLGIGVSNVSPTLFVASNAVGIGFSPASGINNSALTPLQLNAASGNDRYLAIQKAGAAGLYVGYSNASLSLTATSGNATVTGGVLRQMTTDPIYFAVNGTASAGMLSSAARWYLGSMTAGWATGLPASFPLGAAHLGATGTTDYSAVFSSVTYGTQGGRIAIVGSDTSASWIDFFTYNTSSTTATQRFRVLGSSSNWYVQDSVSGISFLNYGASGVTTLRNSSSYGILSIYANGQITGTRDVLGPCVYYNSQYSQSVTQGEFGSSGVPTMSFASTTAYVLSFGSGMPMPSGGTLIGITLSYAAQNGWNSGGFIYLGASHGTPAQVNAATQTFYGGTPSGAYAGYPWVPIATVVTTTATNKYTYTSFTPGTYNFSAGEVLQIYFYTGNFNGTGSLGMQVYLHVQF